MPQPALLRPRPLWTGKQVFSLFLPRVNLVRKSQVCRCIMCFKLRCLFGWLVGWLSVVGQVLRFGCVGFAAW